MNTVNEKTLDYQDLGENPYTPRERKLYFWGGVLLPALSILALIKALLKGEALFFEILNPVLFTIVGILTIIDSKKKRLHAPDQYFVRLSGEGIEFRSPAQKKPVKLLFQQIKEVKRYWNKVAIKVPGSPQYEIYTFSSKQAKALFAKINEHMALAEQPA